MNHIYRTIFNRRTGLVQVVSELTQSQGKPKSKLLISTLGAVIVAGLALSDMALADSNCQTTGNTKKCNANTPDNNIQISFSDTMGNGKGGRDGAVFVPSRDGYPGDTASYSGAFTVDSTDISADGTVTITYQDGGRSVFVPNGSSSSGVVNYKETYHYSPIFMGFGPYRKDTAISNIIFTQSVDPKTNANILSIQEVADTTRTIIANNVVPDGDSLLIQGKTVNSSAIDDKGVVTVTYTDNSTSVFTPDPNNNTTYTKVDIDHPDGETITNYHFSIDATNNLTVNTIDLSDLPINIANNDVIGAGSFGGNVSDIGGGHALIYDGSNSTFALEISKKAAVIGISKGGNGGEGGTWYVGGGGSNGGNGGNGGLISVTSTGDIHVTNGIGVLAKSIGGTGGNGGGADVSFYGDGGDGGRGGSAGEATVTIKGGTIITSGNGSVGVAALSQGGAGGKGGSGFGIVTGAGGSAGAGAGSNATVTINKSVIVQTSGKDAHAVVAQSVGGTGGDTGMAIGAGIIENASAGTGGNAGKVTVTNNGNLSTTGEHAYGILAQSIGGGGGSGSLIVGFNALGSSGAAGGAGGSVEVTNWGQITTTGLSSSGIFAQSIGGGGGDGGFSAGLASFGGQGSATSNAGTVTVYNNNNIGIINTSQSFSYGIFAQSIGGGGGNGGSSFGIVSMGGSGAGGGAGADVTVNNSGTVITGLAAQVDHTLVINSIGIFAQSVGGGGGNGGGAISAGVGLSIAMGGSAGVGGSGGAVKIETSSDQSDSVVVTYGDFSQGVFAQSIGGGGGNGGFAGAASLGISSLALGGTGGDGGASGEVTVETKGIIETHGTGSTGIFAQSVGGGGGNGGFSGAATIGGISTSIALGGTGGGGGDGKQVVVDNSATIYTKGDNASGLFAQSVGKGGGNGGFAGSATIGAVVAIGIALGGSGGGGGDGDNVTVTNASGVQTEGDNSTGIVAQSIGGGGGNGGFSGAFAGSGLASVSVSLGGSGGNGGHSGVVTVNNGTADLDSNLSTIGNLSVGIFAQSIGGGGGNGGFSISASGSGLASFSAAIGGAGGDGATSSDVTINNFGIVHTQGDNASGFVAQSIGGGGGNGGFASAVSGTIGVLGVGISAGVAIGGAGGNADHDKAAQSGEVTLNNTGGIWTDGVASNAILAQSIGGTGGNGGFAASGSITIGDGVAANVAIGGSGGNGGIANNVLVKQLGSIVTQQDLSVGIIAQSIGGSGGNGGFAGALSMTVGQGAALGVSLGGDGGKGGKSGTVQVTNGSADQTSDVYTSGHLSTGILAQSLGGGGGNGGFSVTASASGNASLSASIGGDGGDGASSNDVTVDNFGIVYTKGDNASGFVAQSIGGGGGNGGFAGALSGTLGTGAALGVAIGGAGGNADENNVAQSGDVTLNNNGAIQTDGVASNAIIAQSIGGSGGNGGFAASGSIVIGEGISGNVAIGGEGGNGGIANNVSVTQYGSIVTQQDLSVGIIAQSIGGSGGNGGFAGALSVTVGQGAALGVSLGGGGGAGGQSGQVQVTHGSADQTSDIYTSGHLSTGILAQSLGGGGGNGGFSVTASASGNASLSASIGGAGGYGASSNDVTVDNFGIVYTKGAYASGLVAQSIGGGGGNGGFAGALSGTIGTGASLGVTIGGAGGNGGAKSGLVTLNNTGAIQTDGVASNAILAQSIGGTGGNGGFAVTGGLTIGDGVAANVAIGGSGGVGGQANNVSVDQKGTIVTKQDQSSGIIAQSIGGGGGNGGFSGTLSGVIGDGVALGVSLGGDGGLGGHSGQVDVTDVGDIFTTGKLANGIFAQSIGGNGGNGGFALSGSLLIGDGGSLNASVGGDAGDSDIVSDKSLSNDVHVIHNTNLDSIIATNGDLSFGILAQSIGGNGGNGGFAGTLGAAIGDGVALGVAVGGFAGNGSNSGNVWVDNSGRVFTDGVGATGILAQSLGGSGGNGGLSIATAMAIGDNGVSLAASVGGSGGGGGEAGTVRIDNQGLVSTQKALSNGLWAQSIGGSGGNGGFSVAGNLNVTANAGGGASVSVGGKGGIGNVANKVTINSNVGQILDEKTATIQTMGADSNGIFAQSVGGDGGSGGFSGALSIALGEGDRAGFGISVGGVGGSGNDAEEVNVTSVDNIVTQGVGSNGIFAQSLGGGGGNGGFSGAGSITAGSDNTSAAVSLSLGGSGSEAGDAKNVTLDSTGFIITSGDHANGILAQSLGGGGGNGGISIAGALGASDNSINLSVSVGGLGAAAGIGGNVKVTRNGNIATTGDHSIGLAMQSVGGGGGNGGMSLTGSFGAINAKNFSAALGGFGGEGSHSGQVDLNNSGNIMTSGKQSQAILAQSIGGGGGTGGLAGSVVFGEGGQGTNLNFNAAVGGLGGDGGHSSDVTVINGDGMLYTMGSASQGILAQSIGGGGGNGGSSIAGVLGVGGESSGRSINATFAVGGLGGNGNTSGNVLVTQSALIKTEGNGSYGIQAQSIAGGGGNGGQANALSFLLAGESCSSDVCKKADKANKAKDFSLKLTVGGFGGKGNDAGTVMVQNSGSMITTGLASSGIFAQSIGGGGGTGGNAIIGLTDVLPEPYITYEKEVEKKLSSYSAVGGLKDLTFGVGGYGGSSGNGNTVTVNNTGSIETDKAFSWGVFAQSIGGGGGAGGNAVVGDNGTVGIGGGAFADLLGLTGNIGGDGGTVTITNGTSSESIDQMAIGQIITKGDDHAGALFAQSIGGGGGQSGAGAGRLSIGGDAGTAGDGHSVSVTNYALLSTLGVSSDGITAQSIGGGGGSGADNTATPSLGNLKKDLLSVGGNGGASGKGGLVEVNNYGRIATTNNQSNGIFAQSIGGGGGQGGSSFGAVSIGGSNGSIGEGGAVHVNNAGAIATMGDDATGILAQSIGGGGGRSGNDSGLITFGGAAGAQGDGGAVTIDSTNSTFMSENGVVQSSIVTSGNNSNAIMAQSIGGGGGSSGTTSGVVSFASDATNGGNGGDVLVNNSTLLHTSGDNSTAIFAQSVGGGGGFAAGATSLIKIVANTVLKGAMLNSAQLLSAPLLGAPLLADPIASTGGEGGQVTVNNTASLIVTEGANAHGIFAQSIGGGGGVVNATTLANVLSDWGAPNAATGVVTSLISKTGLGIGFTGSVGGLGAAKDVVINQTGDIVASGVGSFAILGQSSGASNGNILITVNPNSNIIGGTETGAAIGMLDGANNQLNNAGLITGFGQVQGLLVDQNKVVIPSGGWIDGMAVYGTVGNNSVSNSDRMVGSINLGAGTNRLDNQVNAWFVMGDTVALGATTNLFTNEGAITPGGVNHVFTTNMTGSFVQGPSGRYFVDYDLASNTTDSFHMTGSASLNGVLYLNILHPEVLTPGTFDSAMILADQGITNNGLVIQAVNSAAAQYSIQFYNGQMYLRSTVSFAPTSLTQNGRNIGAAINKIMLDHQSPRFGILAKALFYQPDSNALDKVFSSIDGEGTAGIQQLVINDSSQFMNSVQQQISSWRTDSSKDEQMANLSVNNCVDQFSSKEMQSMLSSCQKPRLRTWGHAYTGSSTYDGDNIVGTADYQGYTQGAAGGLDYQLNDHYLVGFALGGGNAHFDIKERNTSGKLSTGNFGLYTAYKNKSFYANAMLSYGYIDGKVTRQATISGSAKSLNDDNLDYYDQLSNKVKGNAISGKIELGYKFALSYVNVTPFAAAQFTVMRMNPSDETFSNTKGNLALSYAGQTTKSLPMSLGLQLDKRFYLAPSSYLETFVRASWVHENQNRRTINASFDLAPNYSYMVDGISIPKDSTQIEVGINLVNFKGLSVAAQVSDNFSKVSRNRSASLRFNYDW